MGHLPVKSLAQNALVIHGRACTNIILQLQTCKFGHYMQYKKYTFVICFKAATI